MIARLRNGFSHADNQRPDAANAPAIARGSLRRVVGPCIGSHCMKSRKRLTRVSGSFQVRRRSCPADVLEDVGARSLKDLYDFGDCWEHTVRIQRITDAMLGNAYQRLVEAAGRYPTEDVGGPGDAAAAMSACNRYSGNSAGGTCTRLT